MKRAICLITIRVNKIWLDFLKSFKNYDIYIVVDDLKEDDSYLKDSYPNLHLIKISDEECKKYGYIHSSYMPSSSLVFNEIIAWDRCLCYFTNNNKRYDDVWFFEDDVFFYNEETLKNIDLKYEDCDILCRDKNPQPKEGEWNWFWPAIHMHFSEPYFHSPICGVRLSKMFLDKLNEYVKINKKLAFIEALLPSIAHYYELKYVIADELNQIHWRKDWSFSEMTRFQIFHPIKNMEQQKEIRDYLENSVN